MSHEEPKLVRIFHGLMEFSGDIIVYYFFGGDSPRVTHLIGEPMSYVKRWIREHGGKVYTEEPSIGGGQRE